MGMRSGMTNSTRLRVGDKLAQDQIREPLFDTEVIAAGQPLNGVRTFFNNVKSKLPYQTNMRIDGQLENGVSFVIQGLSVDSNVSEPQDQNALQELLNHTSVELRIGEKNYWEGPLRFCTGKLDVFHATTVADSEFHHSQFGKSAVNGIILYNDDSLVLESQVSFKVTLRTEGATGNAVADIPLMVSLKGIKRRPIQ